MPARSDTPLLHDQLRWLVALRWLAGVAVVALAILQTQWLHWYSAAPKMLIVGVAILIYNAVLWVTLRPRTLALSARALHVFSLAQIGFDLACLTLLVAWTGGLSSPLAGFYVFHMVFASLLLTRPWAYAAAAFATVLLAAALWTTHQWPADRMSAMRGAGLISTLIVAVYLTSHITRALFRRELSRLKHFRRMRTMSAHLHAQERAMVQHEKMVAMGQMAAGVAHEINNPLAGMDSLLQLMERTPDRPRPDAVPQLRAQVERIQRIVRQLTAFSHPERGQIETADVNEVILATLKLPGFEARLRKVKLTCDLQNPNLPARIISRTLQQALMNLIINALDALAQTQAPTLTLRTHTNNTSAVIEVTDNGPGIPKEHLSRIFEPFFTTKPIGQGTGLGLSISQSLIAEQGGTLEVTSPVTPTGGATFKILLPLPAGGGRVVGSITPPA
jgi:C4-dicarboxylate-specific signal transduction histidine kinase